MHIPYIYSHAHLYINERIV